MPKRNKRLGLVFYCPEKDCREISLLGQVALCFLAGFVGTMALWGILNLAYQIEQFSEGVKFKW